MALYTGLLAVNYTDNVFTSVYFVDTESNFTNLSVDISPYVQEQGVAINVLDSILELFTLYPYIGKIAFQTVGTTSVNYDTSNLITAGTEIFRNQAEFDANDNDELYTTDFTPVVTPPVIGTVDLTPILSAIALLSSKIDLIETKVNSLSNTDLSFTNTQIAQIQERTQHIPNEIVIPSFDYVRIEEAIASISVGTGGATVDLTDITALVAHGNGILDNLELINIQERLQTIALYTAPIDNRLDNLNMTLQSFAQASIDQIHNVSLNGNNSQFFDGDKVSVYSRAGEYLVDSSFAVMVNDSSYTIMYRLLNNGSYSYVPEALLTLIAPL